MSNEVIEVSKSDGELEADWLRPNGGHVWSGPMSWMVPWATVAWGCSLAMIVGREGEWPWILTRLVVVEVLLSMVLCADHGYGVLLADARDTG